MYSIKGVMYLSIHAPTRGATLSTIYTRQPTSTFNPRSYKRSDRVAIYRATLAKAFNPRSYKRSDLSLIDKADDLNLSIHAPTRGATGCAGSGWWMYQAFNPRSYKRSDKLWQTRTFSACSFNPRSYKRSDVIPVAAGESITLSIHAPTRGATSNWCACRA